MTRVKTILAVLVLAAALLAATPGLARAAALRPADAHVAHHVGAHRGLSLRVSCTSSSSWD